MVEITFNWKQYLQQSYMGESIRLFFEKGKEIEFENTLGHTLEDKDTFWWKKDIVNFLSLHTNVRIYLTAGDKNLIFAQVDENSFLIGIEAFYKFQEDIRWSGGQKIEAFLKKESKIAPSLSTSTYLPTNTRQALEIINNKHLWPNKLWC